VRPEPPTRWARYEPARSSSLMPAEPEVERIILLDAPAVLGCEAWRDLAGRSVSA